MANIFRKIITESETETYIESLKLLPSSLAFATEDGWSITKRRLSGGVSDGVDAITLDNGALSFTILPTRGMNLFRGSYHDIPIRWNSPIPAPVNPSFVNLLDHGGFGWLKGMNETLTRCGLYSIGPAGTDEATGEFLTLHGRIANTPASTVAIEVIAGDKTEIAVTGLVHETRFFGQHYLLSTRISTFVGSDTISVRDNVTNLTDKPQELELIYHCNFGAPFLDEGTRLFAPAREIVPQTARAAEDIQTWSYYKAADPDYTEQCNLMSYYADSQDRTLAMLVNHLSDKAVAVRWNVRELPCFTQWKLTSGEHDGYVTGLEPSTAFPNFKAFEREAGRVIILAPGQTRQSGVQLQFLDNAIKIAALKQEVENLAQGRAPQVSAQPQPGWSPAAD